MHRDLKKLLNMPSHKQTVNFEGKVYSLSPTQYVPYFSVESPYGSVDSVRPPLDARFLLVKIAWERRKRVGFGPDKHDRGRFHLVMLMTHGETSKLVWRHIGPDHVPSLKAVFANFFELAK